MTKPIISLAIIILSVIFAFFYVVPEYDLNQTRRHDIETLSKILATSSEIEKLIDDTKKSLDSLNAEGLARFEVFLPRNIDPIRFANNLQYLGRKNSVILSDIKVEGPTNDKSATTAASGNTSAVQGLVHTMSLGAKINQAEGVNTPDTLTALTATGGKFVATRASFNFTTTFEVFQLFLNDLERSLGVINLTSLSITPSAPDVSTKKSKVPPPPLYQFTVGVETYSLQ